MLKRYMLGLLFLLALGGLIALASWRAFPSQEADQLQPLVLDYSKQQASSSPAEPSQGSPENSPAPVQEAAPAQQPANPAPVAPAVPATPAPIQVPAPVQAPVQQDPYQAEDLDDDPDDDLDQDSDDDEE